MGSEQTEYENAYMSSREAAAYLNVSVATLYAYVSRGLLTSESSPGRTRSRRYRVRDLERLRNRQQARYEPERSAERALDWGSDRPILESAITLIQDERFYYRGHDAIQLAQAESIEAVMALLCLGDVQSSVRADYSETTWVPQRPVVGDQALDPLQTFQMQLLLLEHDAPGLFDFRPESLLRNGKELLGEFARIVALVPDADMTAGLASMLQRAWAPSHPEVARLIDAALIICADHELNVSTFAVRCIASSRAPLHSAISGGISALRGSKHGGATLRVEALLDEIGAPDNVSDTVMNRLRRDESIPGFGHYLYPSGDPRGQALLELTRRVFPDSPVLEQSDEVARNVEQMTGKQPNVDYALVSLARSLNLPAGAGLSLMALGRMVGWIAHAIEEYNRNQLIRPRARYTGVAPEVR